MMIAAHDEAILTHIAGTLPITKEDSIVSWGSLNALKISKFQND